MYGPAPVAGWASHDLQHIFSWVAICTTVQDTGPAKHLTTVGWDQDDLDRDLSVRRV